ncbi:NAD(P)-dependent dehydrogenase, short-chain alcohol dehydrogenase family [Caldanaerobius fijiensis DSM 17918]|uniref:NAD(P)-dependent dehydrogenase, short-chain alcohol dehydrogenase family n=1 Tax=Caldanaerobius fijiensis DSM 17918 TaxID=1121256 RepID=A0A1M5EY21_9THEO|nr:SDR family NAD(P)-dependent oxidoreductase [Caldanaerobius fijiensis]SHF83922.1 NAD(P)-dependent dehydrogenase, short-chain alcohol dehydrogenase family [Caldanaerobius fijiensis DSM 17918]
MLLKDKVAIITGAGSGFGRETSLLFAQEGAKIVAVDYNSESGQKTADDIKANNGEAIFVKADVSKEEDVKRFVDEAIKAFGKLDIIFNNAGIYIPGNAEALASEDWDKVININLKGVFLGCKYAIPYLKKNGGGVIINTASAASLIGFPDAVAYAASKGGVLSLTKAIAVDHAKDNIRANCICPGTGETGMTREVLENKELREMFLAPIPLKRFAQPIDVAHAALFLASDMSSYITGVALPVDGGWTMS